MPTYQALSAQRRYDACSRSYDSSWYPALASEYITVASLLPGQHVLDLACGTGLFSLLAKKAVGDKGTVTGIDVSEGMMALAKEKAEREGLDIKWLYHDIAVMEGCKGLREGGYDLIVCCLALMLLDDSASAVEQWTELLKPGGRLITDVPTEDSHRLDLTKMKVAEKMGIKFNYGGLWVKNMDTLIEIVEWAGLDIERCWRSEEYGSSKEHPSDSGAALFDEWVKMPSWEWLGKPGTRERALSLFVEEWESHAEPTGVVRDFYCLYIAVGKRVGGAEVRCYGA